MASTARAHLPEIRTVAVAVWLCLMPATVTAESAAVFTGRTGDTSDLYRLDLASLTIVRLTRSPANEMEAAASPDGRRIVFVSDQGGSPALYLMDAAPDAAWTRLTTDAGAYAHPTFTPDGTRVTARYGSDPAHPLRRTQLVSISIVDGTRTVLVDSAVAFPNGHDDDLLTVVDHPAWFDAEGLLFAAVEYSGGDEAPRLTSSAIWRFAPGTGRLTHLVGGESSFDARGRPRGVKATMPHREGALVAFVGIRGAVDRLPMVTRRTGTNPTAVALRDADFVGPCLAVGKQFLYVIDDGDGNWKLALKGAGDKTRRVVPFAGDASEPALIPERAAIQNLLPPNMAEQKQVLEQAPQAHRWRAVPVLVELYTSPGFTSPESAWSTMPELVVYADGRAIASREDHSRQTPTRSVVEARLQPGDVCTLLAQIEIDGFFKDDTAIYVPPPVTDMSTTHITVRGWLSQTVSAYGLEHPMGAASPGLAKTYTRLRDYQLPRATPYRPERVAVRISSLQTDQAAPLWPLSDPRLADLSSRTDDIVLEGQQAVEVYKLFGEHLSRAYLENGTAYRVTVRPLLPLEQWGSRGWGRMPYAYPLAPTVGLTCGGVLLHLEVGRASPVPAQESRP